MTVSDLILVLQEQPQDADVWIRVDGVSSQIETIIHGDGYIELEE